MGGDDRGFKLLKPPIHGEVHTRDSCTNSSILIFIYRALRQRDRRVKRYTLCFCLSYLDVTLVLALRGGLMLVRSRR